MDGGRRWLGPAALAFLSAGVLWVAWSDWGVRRDRRAIADIEEEIKLGRYGTASSKLQALLDGRPDWDEARNLLGTCAMKGGRLETAEAAWARVSPESPVGIQAIMGRVTLRMRQGRYALAEQFLHELEREHGMDAASLAAVMGPVYLGQGRLEEAMRALETRWEALDRAGQGASETALGVVREYIRLRESPMPLRSIASALDRAARLAPNDDRIWLAKAHLAFRSGSYDDAAHWIDACLQQRHDDIPVWRARLDWAVATNRLAGAREAMTHLPAGEGTPAQVQRWAVWLAVQRGDRTAERKALESLVDAAPSDLVAIDRLIELSLADGQTARADDLRRRKVETELLIARYRELYERNQPRRDAAEMGRLAEKLGRRFEARAFLTRAAAASAAADIRRDLKRLVRPAQPDVPAGRTLADVLTVKVDTTTGASRS